MKREEIDMQDDAGPLDRSADMLGMAVVVMFSSTFWFVVGVIVGRALAR